MSGGEIRFAEYSWTPFGRKNPTLQDVSLTIPSGQNVLIVGASGSGKSTLLRAIAGLNTDEDGHSSGTVEVNARDAQDCIGDVGLQLQDPTAQIVSSTVEDDMEFGPENLCVPREKIWNRVRSAAQAVHLGVKKNHSTSALSGGQKQKLGLAGIVAMGAQSILLDEPTANLDPQAIEDVVSAVKQVSQDRTIVIVEHRIEPWLPLVERIIVLGDTGEILADGGVEDIVSHPQVLSRGIWVPGAELPVPSIVSETQQECKDIHTHDIQTHDLAIGWRGSPAVQEQLNLDFCSGSHCITGANGVGKSTLLMALAGLIDPLAGEVEYCGIKPTQPSVWNSAELAGRVGMVFQQPQYQFMTQSVIDELLLAPKTLGYDMSQAEQRAHYYLQKLRLDHLAHANPFALSGGEQRRLSVAIGLMLQPPVVLLDEPTFAQDRNTFSAVVTLLQEYLEEEPDRTLISVTHDPAYIACMGQYCFMLEGREK